MVCEADNCDRVLGIDVGIYCIAKDGEEKTVCESCGPELMGKGWVDINASDDDAEAKEPEPAEPEAMAVGSANWSAQK